MPDALRPRHGPDAGHQAHRPHPPHREGGRRAANIIPSASTGSDADGAKRNELMTRMKNRGAVAETRARQRSSTREPVPRCPGCGGSGRLGGSAACTTRRAAPPPKSQRSWIEQRGWPLGAPYAARNGGTASSDTEVSAVVPWSSWAPPPARWAPSPITGRDRLRRAPHRIQGMLVAAKVPGASAVDLSAMQRR